MVQESEGPVGGEESQNWVWSSWPPGALKQQVSATAVVFMHDVWGLVQVGGEPARVVDEEVKRKGRAYLDALRRVAWREGILFGSVAAMAVYWENEDEHESLYASIGCCRYCIIAGQGFWQPRDQQEVGIDSED